MYNYIFNLTNGTVEYIRKYYETIFNDMNSLNLQEYLKRELGEDFREKSKFLKPSIKFDMSDKLNPKATDFNNAKLVYENFKNLTESQASDFRLWGGYAIEDDVYQYLKYRWKDTDKTIAYRVVYKDAGKRGLLYNGIARLWWLAHLTIDDKRENLYELTEFTFSYPHIMEKMIYRNFSNSKTIRHGIIEGIQKYLTLGGIFRTKDIDELYKHISLISGVNLLDIIPQSEIKEIAYNFLNNIEN